MDGWVAYTCIEVVVPCYYTIHMYMYFYILPLIM